jgi:hypothetical protein
MSLVSHRWRHLWKYLQVFHFDYSDFKCNKKFALFVNAVLALRRSRDIRKFNLQLEWRFEDYKSVEMWVLAATGPHLEEMSITIMDGADITLPPSFFVNCTNLVSLRYLHLNPSSSYYPELSTSCPCSKLSRISLFTTSEVHSTLFQLESSAQCA